MSTGEVPRMIIVDDIDPRIRYNGPWFPDVGSQDSLGDFGPPFRSTLHGTRANASLEFTYNGSSIQVYGTNDILNEFGVIDPTWECFVDGIRTFSIGPSPHADNNWVFCEHHTVSDGLHTLTVNATVIKNQTFWFGDIRYVPSPSTPLDQEIILVDVTDPQIQYGQGWQIGITNTTGSIVTFDFIGGSISWYGHTFSGNPLPATYSIDGQTPINFFLHGTGGSNQKYFETGQLSVGPHTLKVVYQGNNTTPELDLWYLVVQNGTLPFITTTVFPTSTTTGTSAPSTKTSSPGTLDHTVGGVIGGLALILLGLRLLVLSKRLAAEKKKKFLSSTPRGSDLQVRVTPS